mgnify:CR=1 FL=1
MRPITKNAAPRIRNVARQPRSLIIDVAIGPMMADPAPYPPTISPIARPRLSGNHFDATGVGALADLKAAFGLRAENDESRKVLGREISPINFISAQTPPTLIIHGDADTRVPYQQAVSFVKKMSDAGATAKLVTKPGLQHGWPGMTNDVKILADYTVEVMIREF